MSKTKQGNALFLISIGLTAACVTPPPPSPAKLEDVFILDQASREHDGKAEEIEGGVLVTWTGLEGLGHVNVTTTRNGKTDTGTPLRAAGRAALVGRLALAPSDLVLHYAAVRQAAPAR